MQHFQFLQTKEVLEGGELCINDNNQEVKMSPKEDDVILFDGFLEHCIATPTGIDRRIVLVVNFL